MTEEEIARLEQVLREADRIRQEIALEEAFHTWSADSPKEGVYGLEHSREDVLLLAA